MLLESSLPLLPYSPVMKVSNNIFHYFSYLKGNWRRITVNDFFPYSENGELLVPRSKNRYNIWPLILAKALLQVASLSWEMSGDLKDFSIISCLTGWTRFNVDCRY